MITQSIRAIKEKKMTKNDAKKRITAAIKKLNAMNNNVYFELEETEYSVQLICRSKSIKGTCFGAYGFIGMFDNYTKKSEAYITCMLFAEMMIAATRLNDPAAYHNICA